MESNSDKLKSIANILFLKHPNEHDMTYSQHLKRAWYMAYKMMIGMLALFIHGLIPYFNETRGTDMIKELADYVERTDVSKPKLVINSDNNENKEKLA
jgi:hypothetical protein